MFPQKSTFALWPSGTGIASTQHIIPTSQQPRPAMALLVGKVRLVAGWLEPMASFILVHPWSLTWNLKMMVWKMMFLFNWMIFMFYVNLPGCIYPNISIVYIPLNNLSFEMFGFVWFRFEIVNKKTISGTICNLMGLNRKSLTFNFSCL